jgi:hypothetical protein
MSLNLTNEELLYKDRNISTPPQMECEDCGWKGSINLFERVDGRWLCLDCFRTYNVAPETYCEDKDYIADTNYFQNQ